MTTQDSSPGRLVTMTDAECWDHLTTQPVGRIAWAGRDGVSVVPLNFLVEGHDVVLRTTPYSALSRECDDRDVAFAVDDLDAEHRTGWSVLLRGRCHREDRVNDGPTPWVTGRRVLGLRIEVRSVSGRRIDPS